MVQAAYDSSFALRKAIYREARDPDLAAAIYRAASSRPVRPAPMDDTLPLFRDAARPSVSRKAQMVAHDLSVHLSFLGTSCADRARQMLGPATWRLVQALGGWEALCRLPRSERPQRLAGLVDRHLPSGAAAGCRHQPVDTVTAAGILLRWSQQLPELAVVRPEDVAALGITAGSLELLVDRVAAAVMEGRLAAEDAAEMFARMVKKCPGAQP